MGAREASMSLLSSRTAVVTRASDAVPADVPTTPVAPSAAATSVQAGVDAMEHATRSSERTARMCLMGAAAGLTALVAGVVASVGMHLDSSTARDVVGIVGNLGYVTLIGSVLGGMGTSRSERGKPSAERAAHALNEELFARQGASKLADPWRSVLVRVECPANYTDAYATLHVVYDSVRLNRQATPADERAVHAALSALAAQLPALRGVERLSIALVPR
jgi:hypothetical protein